ncbi:MAG: mannitol-1-phosphate 5-dehydrogenase [Kyrpidia sp.]|nr:mannitol-1-phosphate 5-dehydrogenase [Kyrpidia sp.]
MKALHFGAGNIGRGFIGPLLIESGFRLVFADVATDIIALLNERRSYRVVSAGGQVRVRDISGFDAVHLDSDTCLQEIADADLITTAVGVDHLPSVAGVLAKGLERRSPKGHSRPLTVMACENAIGATDRLRRMVIDRLSGGAADILENVHFANCLVDRIVPKTRWPGLGPADVVTEEYLEWVVEKHHWRIDVVPGGMTLVENLGPYLERKLYLLNGVHAAVAYLGYLNGYRTIGEALDDPAILHEAGEIQREISRGLSVKYPDIPEESFLAYAEQIIRRFRNPHIRDDVTRVGRDPLRKLKAGERLVAPLHLCLAAGFLPRHLLRGIAAAYTYDHAADPQAAELQQIIAQRGLTGALRKISGIDDEDLVEVIENEYKRIVTRRHGIGEVE